MNNGNQSELVAGVNSEAVRSLCLEINDYREKIVNVFNNITDTFEEAKSYLEGDLKPEFVSKYNKLKASYEVISNNIDSYIDEYNALMLAEQVNDFELSVMVNADISYIDGKGDEN